MRILADEGVDRQVVNELRRQDHEVIYIAELAPAITDDDVLKLANERTAILVTTDKDFGDLVFRQNRVSAGTILMRPEVLPPGRKSAIVEHAIGQYGEQMHSCFSVTTPGATRICRKR